MTSTLAIQVPAIGHNSFLNKHLKVAADPWNPFIIFYCNEKEMHYTDECSAKGNLTYGGALWDLLNLIKLARNVTFSIVRPPTHTWGYCYGVNNCTGMIGMVNRREVDFALGIFPCHLTKKGYLSYKYLPGPFTPTLNRAQAVEFTTPIGVMSYYTIIVPLTFQDNLLSITDPLSFNVWICFLICIPSYIGATILMNYVFSGSTYWEAATSSVIRGSLSERKNKLPPKHLYQKILVLVWSWMMMVLISAYKGNLLAMITKPTMNTPFTNADGMVEQTQMKWGFVNRGLFSAYAKNRPQGTTLRKIYDQSITAALSSTTCQSIADNDTAAICDISVATSIIANDFSKSGTCNYYLTKDKILATDSAIAFPVSKYTIHPHPSEQCNMQCFRNEALSWKTWTISFTWPNR